MAASDRASGFGEQSRRIEALPVLHDVRDIVQRRDVLEWVAAEAQEAIAPERFRCARCRGVLLAEVFSEEVADGVLETVLRAVPEVLRVIDDL